jgi:hypothetical protein
MDNWKTIEPSIWKPEKEGDHIIGILISKAPKDENAGYSARYYIDNIEGMLLVWGSAVLDDRMQYVKLGDRIRITFEGKTKNKRNQSVNLFKVEIANEKPSGSDTSTPNSIVEETIVDKPVDGNLF